MIKRLDGTQDIQPWMLNELTLNDEIRIFLRQDLPDDEYKNARLEDGLWGEFIKRYQEDTGREIRSTISKDRRGRWYFLMQL